MDVNRDHEWTKKFSGIAEDKCALMIQTSDNALVMNGSTRSNGF